MILARILYLYKIPYDEYGRQKAGSPPPPRNGCKFYNNHALSLTILQAQSFRIKNKSIQILLGAKNTFKQIHKSNKTGTYVQLLNLRSQIFYSLIAQENLNYVKTLNVLPVSKLRTQTGW